MPSPKQSWSRSASAPSGAARSWAWLSGTANRPTSGPSSSGAIPSAASIPPAPPDPKGIALVISDAHTGLKAAVKAVLPGAGWQRCRVHFARNITQHLGSANSKPVNPLVSTIFAQTPPETVREAYHQVTASMQTSFPTIADMLRDAEATLTAFAAFPTEHWKKNWSNNPIERVNTEIKRRADVVQVFPNRDWVTRLIGAVLLEQHEEWPYGERRYLSGTSMRRLTNNLRQDPEPAALTAA